LLKALEEGLTKQFTRLGLDIICRKGSPQDIGRVREVLKSGFVGYSDVDIEYLRRVGEWDDIPLIVASISRPAPGLSLLSDYRQERYLLAARAIFHLGRDRVSELLSMPMPSRLLTHLVAELPDKVFRNLADRDITPLLYSEDEKVRKAVSLKCARALPKARVKRLLEQYISSDNTTYYNVVHWLDLATSAPREIATRAAQKALAAE
jgi:hypothetical protein